MLLKLLLITLTSAFIGFLTNWLAIKMLFYPERRFFGLQGLLIKRKEALAGSISALVVDRFMHGNPLGAVGLDKFLDQVAEEISTTIMADAFPDQEADTHQADTKSLIKSIVLRELHTMASASMASSDAVEAVTALIKGNIMQIPDKDIKTVLTDIAKTEFRAIELIGAVLGAIIGILNFVIALI